MAGDIAKEEKTEAATPRRREESREMGQVALSSDLTNAIALAVATAAILLNGRRVAQLSGSMLGNVLTSLRVYPLNDLTPSECARLARALLEDLAPALLGLLLPILACGLLVAYGQVGFRVTPKAVSMDLSKINPLKGVQRLFSVRSLFRLGSSTAKLICIGGAMTLALLSSLPRISGLGGLELRPSLAALGNILLRCCAVGVLAILVLALIDFFYQRRQHEVDLRMSKDEVKREHRDTEGDPHVKQRIRRIQRDLAVRRMMADVPKATVVVTNPTHYAVALTYERGLSQSRGGAPRVVAKGVDLVAQRIKEIAREAEVPCYENVALARALYAQTEVGQEIPEELFQAVANVLAYVYRLRGETVSA